LPHEHFADDLYAFIDEHRQQLVAAARGGGIEPQTMSRATLIAALAREAELGARATALLGEGVY
jgi:hypothetical protein